MHRRSILAGLGALPLVGVPGIAPAKARNALALNLFVDREHVGEIGISTQLSDTGLSVDVDIDATIGGSGPFSRARYQQTGRELYRDGLLQEMRFQTRFGDLSGDMTALPEENGIRVEGVDYQGMVSRTAVSNLLYSKDFIDRDTWIDPATGVFSEPVLRLARRVRIKGIVFEAWTMSEEGRDEIYYDADGRWGGAALTLGNLPTLALPGRLADAPISIM